MAKKKTVVETKPIKKTPIVKEKVLSIKEKTFIKKYFQYKFNGTKAYMAINPNVGYDTAKNEASLLMGNPLVKEEIRKQQDLIEEKEDVQLSFLVQTLKIIILEESAKPEFTYDDNGRLIGKQDKKLIMTATDQLAKLVGHYKDKTDINIINMEMPTKIKMNLILPTIKE